MHVRLKFPKGDLIFQAKYVERKVKPRRQSIPEEASARKEERGYIAVIACGLALIMILAFAIYWGSLPHRVKDVEKITVLEAANPEYYADIKAELAEYVFDEHGVKAESIVFKVNIQNYAYELFEVNIWYKDEAGEWYSWNVGWLRIPTDLESTLIREFIKPD